MLEACWSRINGGEKVEAGREVNERRALCEKDVDLRCTMAAGGGGALVDLSQQRV